MGGWCVGGWGGFSYTSRAVICLVFRQERSLSYTPGAVICLVLTWSRVSYTRPVSRSSAGEYILHAPSECLSWVSGEFLLHAP